jgi:hypothetical protein
MRARRAVPLSSKQPHSFTRAEEELVGIGALCSSRGAFAGEPVELGETVPENRTPLSPKDFVTPERPRVTAQWTTPDLSALWEEALRLYQESANLREGEDAASQQEDEAVVLGPVLGEPQDGRIGLLRIERRKHPEGLRLHWILQILPRPSGEPPEEVQKLHAHFKGRYGLVEIMLQSTATGGPPVAQHHIRFGLQADQWDCKVLPRAVRESPADSPVLEICREAAIEHVGYRLQDGISGIEEVSITYLHEKETYQVTTLARAVLKLERQNWLPFADDIQALIMGRFFASKGQNP